MTHSLNRCKSIASSLAKAGSLLWQNWQEGASKFSLDCLITYDCLAGELGMLPPAEPMSAGIDR